jgi:hypothetical protein
MGGKRAKKDGEIKQANAEQTNVECRAEFISDFNDRLFVVLISAYLYV